ncbi:MAG: hypothetical protein SPL35_08045 [Bacteroidales bacterium]|nr:hypothetical protein [Bacteroidales bacterium]
MESTSKHSGWITFSVIVSAIALLCDIIWLVAMMLGESAKFVVFMISAISVFIILPVFILDVAGFISSFFTKDSRKNLLMGLSGAGIGLLILVSILLFNGGVDAKIMEKNYRLHSSEMEQAIEYTLSCLEDGSGLDIEFEGSGKVDSFSIFNDGIWDGTLEPSKNIVDSLAAEIGLSREILNEVRDRLYKAKCHSIRIIKQDGTYDVATLMFKRDMASAYYYEIHNIAMTETEMEAVDADDCERIVFNPHVCFVYGSPAFGDMAFPGKQEYLEGRRSNATF